MIELKQKNYEALQQTIVDLTLENRELKQELATTSRLQASLENKTSDKWIPCSERLPNNTDLVLTTTEHGFVSVAFLNVAYKWCDYDGERLSEGYIIAWMPLPKPYKGGEKNEIESNTSNWNK